MISTNLKLAGCVAAAAALAAGAGYGWARSVHQPQIVDIGSTACGVPETSPRFGLPLEAVMLASEGVPFSIGPLVVPAGGGPMTLRFEPELDGREEPVRLEDAILHLPTRFGAERQPPQRITLHCREGRLGSVRYQGNGRASIIFEVQHRASLPEPAATPTAAAAPF